MKKMKLMTRKRRRVKKKVRKRARNHLIVKMILENNRRELQLLQSRKGCRKKRLGNSSLDWNRK
jgi:hypothetical protein